MGAPFIVTVQTNYEVIRVITMLKQFGCIWVREMQATFASNFIIYIGYIVGDNGVAKPYIAAVNGMLTEMEYEQLKQQLNLTKPEFIGEFEGDWRWRSWDGQPIAVPPTKTSKKTMEREADINMVFLHMFASLKGLPPKVIRELINGVLLTRIHLYETDNEQEWNNLLKFPRRFIFYVLKALKTKNIKHISLIPYITPENIMKIIHHIQALPVQSPTLAKSYLTFSMIMLKEEFELTTFPSCWVEETLDSMRKNKMIKGKVVDLSSVFSSKLIYCLKDEKLMELIGFEQSNHFIEQSKMFALLSGDTRIQVKEHWDEDEQADTVLAEVNSNNLFRLLTEVSVTLRPNGYGCLFMDERMESLASILLESKPINLQIKEVFRYQSPELGSWSAIIFYKKEGENHVNLDDCYRF